MTDQPKPKSLFSATGILLVLALACGLLYAHILKAPFVFDDSLIFDEPHLLWTELTPGQIAGLAQVDIENVTVRFVSNLTFALNYYFGRHHTTGYHLINLAIHILTAFLVFLVARQVIYRRQRKIRAAAGMAALLWLVHPLHIQSVTYIWQRMNSLAALFYMLAFFLYIKARQNQMAGTSGGLRTIFLFSGCMLAGLLAAGSKQTAVTLPLLLFIYEWFFVHKTRLSRLKKRWAPIAITAALAAGLMLILLKGSPLATLLATYADKPFTMQERLFTEPGVILYYLSLLVWPHPGRLNLDYDFPLSASLISPAATLPALAALIALTAAAVLLSPKKRLVSFAILWFLITLIPESSFYGLEIMASYRTYLPSIFLFIALADHLPHSGRAGRAAATGFGIAVVICGIWTFQRNLVWQNECRLWADTVRKSPNLAWPRHNLGLSYMNNRKYDLAIRQYRQALSIKKATLGPHHPETAKTYSNLGVAFDQSGKTDRAARAYRNALKIYTARCGPDDSRTAAVYNNLGVMYGRTGNHEKAIEFCQKALSARLKTFGPEHPKTADIYNNLGMAYSAGNNTPRAAFYFKKALQIFKKQLGKNHPRTLKTSASLRRLQQKP